ncbi:MAG: hypothetical protein CMJ76_13175 [Planctomycetaceae bacterium]|nr:hypothetical protein [Planctomycetaceae bacterium]|tara:strand:- start:885 stop:1583 length:699 start_codon:yes stop_codon:yes gene_type:complete
MTVKPIVKSSTEEFYDDLASSYNDIIYRCAPRYEEMQMTMVDYVPEDLQPLRILDLGCGTGNLTLRVLESFQEAEVVALDLSVEILDVCRRQCGTDRVSYLQQDFNSLDLPESEYDLVVSSIAIHHVDDPAKQLLFQDVYNCLKPGGIFTYVDQFRGETPGIYQQHMKIWKQFADCKGIPPQEWQMWMEHQQQHDYHATVGQQMEWLRQSGFQQVDCLWKHILWTLLTARKI